MPRPILLAATIAALAASVTLAQGPAQRRSVPTGAVNDGLDPSEMICRSQPTLGSRLARARVCATRQQWLDQSRADRSLTEKAQTTRIWCKEGVAC